METNNKLSALTKQQFIGLSWLAYYHECNKQNHLPHEVITCAQNFCTNVLNIPHHFIYDIVINDNIKGLQNFNRLSEVVYYN